MSNSAANFDLLAVSQAGKELRINELINSVSPASLGGRRDSTTTGLTWGYYGGSMLVNGVPTAIANGTVALTASSTNYVGLSQAGVVVKTVTTRNPLHAPLYTVVTSSGAITSYTDERNPGLLNRIQYGRVSVAMADANQTLLHAHASCDTITTTGALTATRDVVVPGLRRRWAIRNTCTGGSVRVISGGLGVTIAVGMSAIVECDGVDVLRLTADV